MKASYKLPAKDDIKGEGNFYALAKTDDAIYVTCNGDDTRAGFLAPRTQGQRSYWLRALSGHERSD